MPTVIYLNRYVDFRSKDSYNFGNKNLTIWVSLDRSTRWKQLGRTICATRIPKTSWIMKMPVPIPHNYLAPIQSSSMKMWTTDCCRHDCFCSPIILEKSVYMSCGPKKKGGVTSAYQSLLGFPLRAQWASGFPLSYLYTQTATLVGI